MTILVPLPEDFAVRRADLTFGLRSAILFFQELAVPGIGGAWYVRHFSWPIAAISLAREAKFRFRPATIANALEALANKAEWAVTPEEDRVTLAVLGKRAFAREPHEWRFGRLKERECYVQATRRQTVTRSLPSDVGLGFALEAGRFNNLELSEAGRELAEAFLDSTEQQGLGKGRPFLRLNLSKWIEGTFKPGDYVAELCKRLGYRHATRAEKNLVRGRLLSAVPPTHTAAGKDPKRRSRLAQCLEKTVRGPGDAPNVQRLQKELCKNGAQGQQHAEEIETALLFDEMREAAVRFLARLAELVDQAGNRVPVGRAARDEEARDLCGKLRQCAQAYLERPESTRHRAADTFADHCSADVAEATVFVVRRDDRILQTAGGAIWRGPVFRSHFAGGQGEEEVVDAPDKLRSGRPRRIFQFAELLGDCNGPE